jgi:hypothetical protein
MECARAKKGCEQKLFSSISFSTEQLLLRALARFFSRAVVTLLAGRVLRSLNSVCAALRFSLGPAEGGLALCAGFVRMVCGGLGRAHQQTRRLVCEWLAGARRGFVLSTKY